MVFLFTVSRLLLASFFHRSHSIALDHDFRFAIDFYLAFDATESVG